jgi:photosystem II stability/assembly factor-like uncharacterized protein
MSNLLRFASYVFLLLLSACSLPFGSARADEIPTPYPDTPEPAALEAVSVNAPQMTSLHMLDELNGWGVTETSIVRTNDGGATWYDLSPDGPTELGYLVSGFFLDAEYAWIILPDPNDYMHSGTLYRTQDGGAGWTPVSLPFGGGDLTFIDERNGWMLADLGAGAGSNAVAVFQTSDGGATWTRTYINDPTISGAGDSLPLGGIKGFLVPLDMQTAWVGGVVYASGSIYLFRTDDAGGSWSPVSLPLPETVGSHEFLLEDLQIVSPDSAYLTMHLMGDVNQLAVYLSEDGGDTWSLTPTLIPEGGSVDFVSAQEGVVWSGTQFYVTRDAARTWTIVPPDLLFGDTFVQMDFVNADTGWVITYDSTARYNLYKTTDSGATWTPLYP